MYFRYVCDFEEAIQTDGHGWYDGDEGSGWGVTPDDGDDGDGHGAGSASFD